eukprot:GEMP01058560.1.p1 GENE.GEMP01058560.1~~GEMP01058560.1.p1  ORF type:complete len:102 (-),score=7.26 GEMP01058560.1:985-1290(-)
MITHTIYSPTKGVIPWVAPHRTNEEIRENTFKKYMYKQTINKQKWRTEILKKYQEDAVFQYTRDWLIYTGWINIMGVVDNVRVMDNMCAMDNTCAMDNIYA